MLIIFFYVLLCLAFGIAAYLLSAYTLMCLGRKAGLKSDWMPYVPVARTLYRLYIVREPWWKAFFIGDIAAACMTLLTLIWNAILGNPIQKSFIEFSWDGDFLNLLSNLNLVAVIPCLYIVAIIVFTFMLHYKTFKVFGFNPYFAFAPFVVPAASSVIYYLIAFSNLYDYVGLEGTKPSIYNEKDNYRRRPVETDVANKTVAFQEDQPTGIPKASSYIRCIAGAYREGTFPIRDGEELVIGRDSTISQIVVTSAAKVSRRHCGIRYSAIDNRYFVTDYSSNGTYLEDGTRLNPMTPTPVSRGTVILVGDQENKFQLN